MALNISIVKQRKIQQDKNYFNPYGFYANFTE